MADSTASNDEPNDTTSARQDTAPKKRRAARSSAAKTTKTAAKKTTRKATRPAAPAAEDTAATAPAGQEKSAAATAGQPRKRRAARTSGTKATTKTTAPAGRSGDIQTARPVVEGPDADNPVEQAVQATAAAGTAESAVPTTDAARDDRATADRDVKMANPSADAPVTSTPAGSGTGTRKKTKRAVKRPAVTVDATTPAPADAVQETTAQTPAAPAGNAAAGFDRTQLGEKTRVHVLARALGMSSRNLIVALDELGMVKVAQSSLSRAEAERLLDALDGNGAATATPATQEQETTEPDTSAEDTAPDHAADGPAEPVEKIRTRVRKNVANEIHQIEEKVEADLAAVVEEHGDSGLLEDVTPAITPKPEPAEEAAVRYAPVFMAPRQSAPAAVTRPEAATETDDDTADDAADAVDTDNTEDGDNASRRRRRGRRGAGRGRGVEDVDKRETDATPAEVDEADTDDEDEELPEEPVALKGSTRLESQRRRRAEMREEGRKKRHIVTQAEFLARRESVERTMVVRERERHDHAGLVTQVGVLEDDLLAEHFVTSETQSSMIGNIYLGRVQNVLPSMEAAFIDIGKGRNGVLYAGEVDWKSAGLGGRGRRIEQALKSGDQVLVQVTKDPVGHKGARLTTQISLAGRYLVYVPGGRSAGISRKLPGPERKRLKEILNRVVPGQGGAIIRTAAENVPEEAIAADVNRLHRLWEDIQTATEKEKQSKGAKPVTLYEEPDMLVKVVRDLFNEDFSALVVDGERAWKTVHAYVKSVAPDLLDRVEKFDRSAHDGNDAFEHFRVDEQLQKALSRKVWLPSGGTLIIERTEAMTVVDVNTGKFTGSGGNLEETVTRNNLEAAEEIVRQLRLRDIGGMIVVDFIDMVLPENQDLVLRRLTEALGRDRTRHQVSEVTSLGLVQMTRKRLGTGLLETFSTECEHCSGSGFILHDDPVDEQPEHDAAEHADRAARRGRRRGRPEQDPSGRPVAAVTRRDDAPKAPAVSSGSDIEELAASVIVSDDTDTRTEEKDEQDRRQAPRRNRRGRGRGRDHDRDRNRDRSRDEDRPSDIEEIVSAALELAEETDPDEPSGADLVPEPITDVIPDPLDDDETDVALAPTGERSFQQAVADWERSPRRRRRTRGNSRSDQRPRPEGFAQAPAGSVIEWDQSRAAEDTRDDRDGQPKSKAAAEQPARRSERSDAGGDDSPRRRGRRRSTRGGQGGQDGQRARDTREPEKQAAEKPAVEKQPAEARRNRPSEVSAGAPEQPARRGRRRAVRRTTTTPDVEKQQTEPRKAEPRPGKTEPAAENDQRRSGRGRRRAVRRTSSS